MENNDIINNSVLKLDNICKLYNHNLVLTNLCMNVYEKDIYGLIGENGSGKTKIIRIVTGLIKPNSGSYSLFNIDSKDKRIFDVRKNIGAIVEAPSIYLNMSALDNMRQMGVLLNIKDDEKFKEILRLVGLSDVIDSKKVANNFSLGMRQRLGIGMSLLSNPKLLILDEPMNGLDPEGIVGLRNLLLDLNEKGITIIISSHILSELSLIATRYGIISKGQMIKEVSNEEVKEAVTPKLMLKVNDIGRSYELLKNDYQVLIKNDSLVITGNYDLNIIISLLQKENIYITNINQQEENIEDYYMNLINGGHYNE